MFPLIYVHGHIQCKFKVYLQSKSQCFFSLNLTVQSLPLDGCFHISLLTEESFSVLFLNVSLKRVPTSMICYITTSLESIMVQYAAQTSVKLKLEASSTYTVNFQYSRGNLLQTVKLLKSALFSFLTGMGRCILIRFIVGKSYQKQIIIQSRVFVYVVKQVCSGR